MSMIVKLLFFVLIVSAVFHLIYQMLVAPTLRTFLGYRLSALRDRSRYLWLTSIYKDDPAFRMVDSCITLVMENLDVLNGSTLVKAARIKMTKGIISLHVRDRRRIMDQTNVVELTMLMQSLDRYTLRCILINSGGLIAWMAPLILIGYIAMKLSKSKIDFGSLMVWPVLPGTGRNLMPE